MGSVIATGSNITTTIINNIENVEMNDTSTDDNYGRIDYITLLLDGIETNNLELVKYVTDKYKPHPAKVHNIMYDEDIPHNSETYNHLKDYIIMFS